MGIEGDNLMQLRGIVIPAGNLGGYTISGITFMLMASFEAVAILGKDNRYSIHSLFMLFITLFGN